MTWKATVVGLLLAVGGFGLSGCAAPDALKEVVCASDEIRPGDTLTISLVDIPEPVTDKEYPVRVDGTITLPLNVTVKAAGMKFAELESEIRKSYVPRLYTRLTAIVRPGIRYYTVGGEVKQPNRQIYVGQTTALRAIISCGDFTEFANRRKVEIIRADGSREIFDANRARKDPSKFDRAICPGDAIYVPRSSL